MRRFDVDADLDIDVEWHGRADMYAYRDDASYGYRDSDGVIEIEIEMESAM